MKVITLDLIAIYNNFFKNYARVLVTDAEETYDSYQELVEYYFPDGVHKFKCYDLPSKNAILSLIKVIEHPEEDTYVAFCQAELSKQIYIIDVYGICFWPSKEPVPFMELEYNMIK